MQIFKDHRSLGFLIVELSRLLRKHYDMLIQDLGISTAQWSVLVHVCRQDGLTQIELAEKVEIEQPTLVRHLDNLEKQNLIERRLDTTDRRVKRIFMKNECHPLIKSLEDRAAIGRKIALSSMTEKEIEHTFDVLERMKINLLEHANNMG